MAQYPQPDTPTESGTKSSASFREKAGEELREFIVLTAYLYICFASVSLIQSCQFCRRTASLDAPLGLAIVGAAICAKFMLMGRVFHLGERFKNLPLIVPTLHRSFVFLLLLAVLTFIEEIVVGTIHGRTVMDPISGIVDGRSLSSQRPFSSALDSRSLLCISGTRRDRRRQNACAAILRAASQRLS